MTGQDRSGQFRKGQNRSGQVRTGRNMFGQVRKFKRCGDRSVVEIGWDRLGLVRTG